MKQYIPLTMEGFIKSELYDVYAKVWYKEPINEYVYVLKEGIDKDSFPYKDLVVYNEYELSYCNNILVDKSKTWQEKESRLKQLHFILKHFCGVVQHGRLIDPDPSRKNAPDSKYWVRLYEFVNSHFSDEKREFLREAVKAARIRGFELKYSQKQQRMTLNKPLGISQKEYQAFYVQYFAKYAEELKSSIEFIEDCSTKLLRKMATEGAIEKK